MTTVPKPQRGQRSWTDAQRAEQARKIRDHQIWLKSTGPKTPHGKRTSSRNSYKNGSYTYEKQILRWYVRLAAMRIKQITTRLNDQNQKRENELLNKYGIPKPATPDIRAFYPYFKVHPLDAASKRGRQPRPPRQKSKDQEIFDYLTSLSGE